MNVFVTSEEMYHYEKNYIRARGITMEDLMDLFVKGMGQRILADYPFLLETYGRILLFCGPGNNGADGWALASFFADRGFNVSILSDRSSSELCLKKRELFIKKYGESHVYSSVEEVLPIAQDTPLFIDALFGIGVSSLLRSPYIEFMEFFRSVDCLKVAVDLPSGVGGADGSLLLEEPLRVDVTYAAGFFKYGNVFYPAAEYCGRIEVISFPDDVVCPINLSNQVLTSSSFCIDDFPIPSFWHHKHSRGSVMVTGSTSMPTASCYAATAARRIGAGICYLAVPKESELIYHILGKGCIIQPFRDTAQYKEMVRENNCSCYVVGPGLEEKSLNLDKILAVLCSRLPCVLDAGFFQFSSDAVSDFLHPLCVLTPHWGEMLRFFPDICQQFSSDVVALVKHVASVVGCTVLLKGANTVIADPVGRLVVHRSSSFYLATSGSGDVLTGIIAGLIAQGKTPFEAASLGAWIHGFLGHRLGIGLIAEDLIEEIPSFLRDFLEAKPLF